jgi:uncharacterized protein YyaL (SSP411 family)
MTEPGKNRLSTESSPYLRQHGGNPVEWYPWGDEAFARAEREDRPVLLSIGYSTCHWCHVMAHESFEDAAVARLLNDSFVCIKVDREERPDIDLQYMKVCQMMTGSGGWPLTIFLAPDKSPFLAATYIPRETRFGRLGLLELLPRVTDAWRTRRAELVASAQQIVASLREPASVGENAPGEPDLRRGYDALSRSYDAEWGGFGAAPKFPTPHHLLFLLRYWKRTGDAKALLMVENTLAALQRGGIQDHVGYGFHRYATDRRWLVPHFEKMLYDQALLSMAFVEAFQATRKEEYALTARHTIDYVLRNLRGSGGAFHAAEDADSEGIEGQFYLWTVSEITSVLGRDEAALFIKAFNIADAGNFAGEATGIKTGSNIPHLGQSPGEGAADAGQSPTEVGHRLETARQRLFAARERRVHPGKDDKVLTDWNGLMVAALAQAGRVLAEPAYVDAAVRAAGFILERMIDGHGQLSHCARVGGSAVPGNIDDYAFFIHGLLELYQATFDAQYLKRAMALQRRLTARFWDEVGGGFYFTADDAEPLLARQKESYDGALPSGNAVAMLNLLRLARITGDGALEQQAGNLARAFAGSVRQSPAAHTQLLTAIDFATGPSQDVVVTGRPGAADVAAMIDALNSAYLPRSLVLFVSTADAGDDITTLAPFTQGLRGGEGGATAYVCADHTCRLPTTDPAVVLHYLGAA